LPVSGPFFPTTGIKTNPDSLAIKSSTGLSLFHLTEFGNIPANI